MRIISQLIKGILRVFKKFFKNFNDPAVLTCFVLPASGVFSIVLILNLNDSECTILPIEPTL